MPRTKRRRKRGGEPTRRMWAIQVDETTHRWITETAASRNETRKQFLDALIRIAIDSTELMPPRTAMERINDDSDSSGTVVR